MLKAELMDRKLLKVLITRLPLLIKVNINGLMNGL
jgi:hypothetical protein